MGGMHGLSILLHRAEANATILVSGGIGIVDVSSFS